MQAVNEVIDELLDTCTEARHSQRELNPGYSRLVPSCKYYEGLLEAGPLFNKCFALLTRQYEAFYESSLEIDEREFIKEGFPPKRAKHLPPSASSIAIPASGHQQPHHAGASEVADPQFRSRPQFGPTSPMGTSLELPSPLLPSPVGWTRTRSGWPAQQTPMAQALSGGLWLNLFVRESEGKSSDRLWAYYKACKREVGAQIERRAWQLARAIFRDDASLQRQHTWTGHGDPALMAVKVFYKVLEAVLRAEEERACQKDFTSLLTSESFNRCLLGCSAEVVAEAHRMPAYTFPFVLHRLAITPFDFSKMIELFTRSVPSLPKEMRKHLFEVEEQIIECLAWEPGSPIYGLLRTAVANEEVAVSRNQPPDAPQTPQRPQPYRIPHGGCFAAPFASASAPRLKPSPNSAFKTFVSPVERDTNLHRADRRDSFSPGAPTSSRRLGPASPLPRRLGPSPLPPRRNPSRTVLGDFFRKALNLARLKLADIGQGLCFHPLPADEVLRQAAGAIQFALYERTELFYNRHLDQVLLGALFGVCKVNNLDSVTFQEIINQYKRQPHTKPEVYMHVVLKQRESDFMVERTGDIKEFYNMMVMPALSDHLRSAALNAGPMDGTGTPVRRDIVRGGPSLRMQQMVWPSPTLPETRVWRGRDPTISAATGRHTSSRGTLASEATGDQQVAQTVRAYPSTADAVPGGHESDTIPISKRRRVSEWPSICNQAKNVEQQGEDTLPPSST
eukprot:evm.model.scf_783.2 EVM.evm.TU.scf_783.2   scf_783:20045-36081(-)